MQSPRPFTGDPAPTLLIATGNAGKAREISQYLADLPLKVLHLGQLGSLPECHEDQPTFLENAVKKSRHYWTHCGLVTLADDSGLEIDALNGLPGVYSARFAGPAATDQRRVTHILEMMLGINKPQRGATFVCALALAWHSGGNYQVEQRVRGTIAFEPRGEKGFGYDPIFHVSKLGKTFAELSTAEKSAISHRGRALAQLREFLSSCLRVSS